MADKAVNPAIVCAVCGSPRWVACAAGTEPEARVQGNLCLLYPAPEVTLLAWCRAHWPLAVAAA